MNDKTIKNRKIEVSPAELRLKAYRAGIKLRSRQPNRANFNYEETTGQDWSVSLNRWVTKHRIVDRDADRYLEFVVDDETGDILHECEEKLSDHQGRGLAKKK